MYDLRQPPTSERGQKDEHDELPDTRSRHGEPHFFALVADGGDAFEESAHFFVIEHVKDHDHDAHEHDDALDKIRNGGGEISPEKEVDRRQKRHDQHHPDKVDAEHAFKEVAEPRIHAGGIGQQKHHHDQPRQQFQMAALITRLEKFGHGLRAEMHGHVFRSSRQHDPCDRRADHGVADADPQRRKTERISLFARIADKDDRGKIRRAVGERGQPAAHIAVAEQRIPHRFAPLAREKRHEQHSHDVQDEYRRLDKHIPIHKAPLKIVSLSYHTIALYAIVFCIIFK